VQGWSVSVRCEMRCLMQERAAVSPRAGSVSHPMATKTLASSSLKIVGNVFFHVKEGTVLSPWTEAVIVVEIFADLHGDGEWVSVRLSLSGSRVAVETQSFLVSDG